MKTETPTKPKLLEQLRSELRYRHYAYQTEKSYLAWVKQYVIFHNKRHPGEMGGEQIKAFLTHLAVKRNVAASTQNQALCAIVFLYKYVLRIDLGDFSDFQYATRPKTLPVVLTVKEVQRLLEQMKGIKRLLAELLYGTGMRLTEALGLRVKDLDFDRQVITVRDAKGKKDRCAVLPTRLAPALRTQLEHAHKLHQRDLEAGYGTVSLPHALERKYPNALRDWRWQFVFPSRKLSVDPRSKRTQRHHLYQNILQRAIAEATRKAGITKKVHAHTMRHSYATHLLESGTDIRTIQTLLGHSNIQTTTIYTHVAKIGHLGVSSPLDRMYGAAESPLVPPHPSPPDTACRAEPAASPHQDPGAAAPARPEAEGSALAAGERAAGAKIHSSNVRPPSPGRLRAGSQLIRHAVAVLMAFVAAGWTQR